MNVWLSQLAASWLGAKKAELILKKCRSEVSVWYFNRSTLRLEGAKGAGATPWLGEMDSKWKDLCLDDEKMASINAARSLFQFAMPVVGSGDVFDEMEKNRSTIINKKTGKPLTDDEILAADLSDLSFVKLQSGKEFQSAIIARLDTLKEERTKITKEIGETQTKAGSKEYFDLSDEQKDFMFGDGTVYDLLTRKKLIDPIGNQSNGAFCLMAKYEPSFTGEIFNVVASSAFAGGIIMRTLRGVGYATELTAAQQVKKGFTLGMALTASPQLFSSIRNACTTNLTNTNKLSRSSKGEVSAFVSAASLPQDLGYQSWNSNIDPSEIPACKNAMDKNLILNGHKESCLFNVFTLVAPLQLSLPAIVIQLGQ